jgi:hypothetical protein
MPKTKLLYKMVQNIKEVFFKIYPMDMEFKGFLMETNIQVISLEVKNKEWVNF